MISIENTGSNTYILELKALLQRAQKDWLSVVAKPVFGKSLKPFWSSNVQNISSIV